MNLVISSESRLLSTPDGAVWTKCPKTYAFWSRYLEVFDEVRVLTRVLHCREVSPDMHRSDGPGVQFIPLPYYLGPRQYLSRYVEIRRLTEQAAQNADAAILYVPGVLSFGMARARAASGLSFAVEVHGDPWDAFAPGALKHPLRSFFRFWFTHRQKQVCDQASGALYLTEHALQRRYPCRGFQGHASMSGSEAKLAEMPVVAFPRNGSSSAGGFRLIFVGTLAQNYKRPDVLLSAVARCVQAGFDLKLTILGDGRHRQDLEKLAAGLGIGERVCFLGGVPAGPAVMEELDKADLFVLPSAQEGLPRALVEACGRGLPCIATSVGGIPEILPREDLVAPGDVQALADKIVEVLDNRQRMVAMSARNLATAARYLASEVDERRREFYRRVREATELALDVGRPSKNRLHRV